MIIIQRQAHKKRSPIEYLNPIWKPTLAECISWTRNPDEAYYLDPYQDNIKVIKGLAELDSKGKRVTIYENATL